MVKKKVKDNILNPKLELFSLVIPFQSFSVFACDTCKYILKMDQQQFLELLQGVQIRKCLPNRKMPLHC